MKQITDVQAIRSLTILEAHTNVVSAGKRLIGPSPGKDSRLGSLRVSALALPGRRAAALAVDVAVALPLIVGLFVFLRETALEGTNELPKWLPFYMEREPQNVFLVVAWAGYGLYLLPASAILRSTIGQRMLGLCVVMEDLDRPGRARAAWRALVTLVVLLMCWNCLALLAVVYAASQLPATLPQDGLSRTWLVNKSELEVESEDDPDSTPQTDPV